MNTLKSIILNKKNKYIKIQKEIDLLEEKKRKLIAEINDIDEKDEFATGETYTKNHVDLYYKILPLEYIPTIFNTRRESLLKYINATFEEFIIDCVLRCLDIDKKEFAIMSIAMLCETVIQTKDGPVLILSDPYKRIKSQPLKVDFETAASWVGRIVVARIKISKTVNKDKQFEIKGIKVLKYTLYGIIDETGNENKITYSGLTFKDHINCEGNEECIEALSNIEKDLIKKGYITLRRTDHILSFRKDDIIELLVIKHNKLNYLYKKVEKLSDWEKAILKLDDCQDQFWKEGILAIDYQYHYLFE